MWWLTIFLLGAVALFFVVGYIIQVASASSTPNSIIGSLLFSLFNGKTDPKLQHVFNQYSINLANKTVLITGGSSGLGKALSKHLAESGATVYVTCLPNDANKPHPHSNIHSLVLDLSDFDSIESFIGKLKSMRIVFDVFVSNAGVFRHKLFLTKYGFEECFAINYVGAFQVTNSLIKENLFNTNGGPTKSNRPRIIFVASDSHQSCTAKLPIASLGVPQPYSLLDGLRSYGESKFLLMTYVTELSRRQPDFDILSICPGPFFSNIGTDVPAPKLLKTTVQWFRKAINPSAEQASLPIAILASKPLQTKGGNTIFEEIANGSYFFLTHLKSPSPLVLDRNYAKGVWTKTEQLIKEAHPKSFNKT